MFDTAEAYDARFESQTIVQATRKMTINLAIKPIIK